MLKKVLKSLEQYSFFETLKHTSNYFGGQLLIQVLGFFSLMVYTYFLTTEEFGIVEVFFNLGKILVVVLPLGLHTAVGRYYLEEKSDYKEFLGTSLILSLGFFTINFALLYYVFGGMLPWLNLPSNLYSLLFIFVLSHIVFIIFNSFFIARNESFKQSKVSVFMSYGRFFGAVVLLLLMTIPYQARIMGESYMALVVSIYMVYLLYPHIKINIKKAHVRYILTFSIPLIPYSLSSIILHYSDQLIINKYVGNGEAGLYSFAYKIGFLYHGFDQALQNASKADFYKWMNRKLYPKVKAQVKSMLKMQVLAATFLILFASDLGYLLSSNKAFTASLHLVPIIIGGYFFFTIYIFYTRLIFFLKKTGIVSILTMLAVGVNVALNLYYIPIYGYGVAAYTTLISLLLMAILSGVVAVFIYKLPPPPLGKMLMALLVLSVIYALYWGADLYLDGVALFFVKAAIFGVVGSVLFGKKVLEQLQVLRKG